MAGLWIGARATRFVDPHGRQVILRGLNLGGDCKLPYPDGGTHHPSDFSDHESVSFVGRPFPLPEADEHLQRIAAWGFNCLRLVVTWEAVEHAGPRRYDQAYLDYIGRICERAQAHGLAVFVDFHQDAWSRMSGGSGAPGWVFARLGLDFRSFGKAGAAHVMQYCYDYASPQARQEERYPSMSWTVNYRLPVNGILWSAFFAGATLTPAWRIDGVNVQDYLQSHYLGAMAALAQRLRDLPNVIGFDSLNEPGLGWIGQKLSQRETLDHSPLKAGPSWTPLDGLKVARGLSVTIPFHVASADRTAIVETREITVNAAGLPIWLPDAQDPFEAAGAWRGEDARAIALDEDFFRARGGRLFNAERDFLAPFFHRVAATIREIRPDWLLFAELSPYAVMRGAAFPDDMPAASVNASHWYDVLLLWSKRWDGDGTPAWRRKLYDAQLAHLAKLGSRINGGAPTLIGEFGVPYDLNQGESYALWQEGRRDPEVWRPQREALQSMYEAMDALLLSSAQWNYTASNRNDARIGDGWNQEDLSVFSTDQLDETQGVRSGARALEGFCRPYVQRAQGTILRMAYDARRQSFETAIDAAPAIEAPTEIYLPAYLGHPRQISVDGEARWEIGPPPTILRVWAQRPGRLQLTIRWTASPPPPN